MLNPVKTYKSLDRGLFLRIMINSLFCIIIHTIVKHKVDGKHIIFTYESMTEQKVFHVTQIADFKMEHFYSKLCDATVCNYSKQTVMGAPDYTEAAYRDVRIFMQLMECCVFNRHFDNVKLLMNNLMF